MINTVDHNITVDLGAAISKAPDIRIKQQDTNSHKFIFTVAENGTAYDLTGLTARAYFTKSDGNVVYQDCAIDDSDGGIMSTILTTQCLTYVGFVSCEITIYGTVGELLTSASFMFRVLDLDRDDTAIESSSEFISLTNMMITAGQHEARIDSLENEVQTARGIDLSLDTRLDNVDTELGTISVQLEDVTLGLEDITLVNVLSLPVQYDLVVGDTFELFYRGIMRVNNPLNYCVFVQCDIGYAYKRKYVYTPLVGDIGTHQMTISIIDDTGRTVDTKTTNLVVHAKSTFSGKVPIDDGTHNLIDISTIITNYWIAPTFGGVESNAYTSAYCITDYINVIGGQTYAFRNGYVAYSYAIYDSEDALIAFGQQIGAIRAIPANGAKIRLCFKNQNSALSSLVFAFGSTAFSSYVNTFEEYLATLNRILYTLCIGDSLTANGEWVTECFRRLTATGGTPTGEGLTNIEFIGTVGTLPKYEGYGGWTYDMYNSSISPFYIGGAINFASYASNLSIPTIDVFNVLLGWNTSDITEEQVKSSVRIFINNIRSSYPQSVINLFGIEVGDADGMGLNYKATWDWFEKLQYVMNLNDWYEEVAAEYTNVYFVQVSGQFDTENNMQQGTRAVNNRNTTTETYGSNGVHPANSGYLQIADVAYRAMTRIFPLFE